MWEMAALLDVLERAKVVNACTLSQSLILQVLGRKNRHSLRASPYHLRQQNKGATPDYPNGKNAAGYNRLKDAP